MMRIFALQVLPSMLKQLRHSSSSSLSALNIVPTLCSGIVEKEKQDVSPSDEPPSKSKRKLVSTVFEKLNDTKTEVYDAVSKMIVEAKDLESLLSIVTHKKLTKKHALKFVSTLADWTVEGKVKTSEFEKDSRFGVVCRLLGTEPMSIPSKDKGVSDLNTVLGVASDTQAAKMISSISLSQMVKILSTLASRKRRSTPLLRSLAYNIASCHDQLDIKQGADALYALATLNFHDEVVVDKICTDLCGCILDNERRAVVGSIITSLGLLRYKHIDLLNLLCEWVQKHLDVCAPQDLTSLVMTLAIVYHMPSNEQVLFPMLLNHFETNKMESRQEWLDLVWGLTILNKQTPDHIASVLSPTFVDNIQVVNPGGLSVPMKLKLLNINGVARLRLTNYTGPLLNTDSPDWSFPILRSKEKQSLVVSVQEALLNLLPSAIYLNTNVNTNMGYMIDGECLMNTKLTPLALFDKKTKTPIDRSNTETQRGIKLAVLVYDYHDMTRGRRELLGVNILNQELTRLKGYRIVPVDYLDFNPRSKIVEQVHYLNHQLKNVMGKS